jgi:hypothetical protein
MTKERYFDFDSDGKENQVEPKYIREDLLDEDSNPILCDVCNDGMRLVPYLTELLICPRCMTVVNPMFDRVKHEPVESTIEEMQDTHTGTFDYVGDEKQEPKKTRIHKKLNASEEPDYVKREIEAIHWRKGYKTVELDKEKLSSSRPN